MQISHKAGTEGKPRGRKPSPKKRDKKGCMDGWSNQDPPIMTYIHVYTRKNGEGQNPLRGKSTPQKGEEGDEAGPPP